MPLCSSLHEKGMRIAASSAELLESSGAISLQTAIGGDVSNVATEDVAFLHRASMSTDPSGAKTLSVQAVASTQ